MPGVDARGWLDAISTNAGQLASAVREAGPDARVATCPDWAVADLLDHVSGVHRRVARLVERRAQERPADRDFPTPGDDNDRLAWFEEGAARLVDVLGNVGPDEAVWNWRDVGPGRIAFWQRRMAHETVIHRADAQSATGRMGGVEPPEVAVDGIDELLELLVVRLQPGDERLEGLAGSLHVHATDAPGEWQVEISPDGVTVRRQHGKAAVAVRGPAADLELFLYNRRSADGLEVFGDKAFLDAWRARVRF